MSSYKEQRFQYLSKVLNLYRAGLSKGEILREVPIQRRTMDRWIEKYSVRKKPSGYYHSSKKEKYYNEVIRLYLEDGYGEEKISRILPIGHTTVGRWIANFVAEQEKKASVIAMKPNQENRSEELDALKAKVAELEEQLRIEKMRVCINEKMIDIAEQKFNIPIRKKAGAKQ